MKRFIFGVMLFLTFVQISYAEITRVFFHNARIDIADPIINAIGGIDTEPLNVAAGGGSTETSSANILTQLAGDTQLRVTVDSIVVTETKAPRQERVTIDSGQVTVDTDVVATIIQYGQSTETTLLDLLRKFDTDVIAAILQYGQATETTLLNIYNKLSDTARVTVLNNIMDTVRIFGQVRTVIDSIVVTETKAPRQERVVIDSPSLVGDTDVVATIVPFGAFTETTGAGILRAVEGDTQQRVSIDSAATIGDTDIIASILPFGHATETSLSAVYLSMAGDTSSKVTIDSIVVTETKATRQERVVIDSPVRVTTDSAVVTDTHTAFRNRTDTFTGTVTGETIALVSSPLKSFSIQVKGTGAAATSWDVRLEGSIDGQNFSQILQHTTTTGDGAVLYSGATLSPSLFIRTRVSGLVLGLATNIIVSILGVI